MNGILVIEIVLMIGFLLVREGSMVFGLESFAGYRTGMIAHTRKVRSRPNIMVGSFSKLTFHYANCENSKSYPLR